MAGCPSDVFRGDHADPFFRPLFVAVLWSSVTSVAYSQSTELVLLGTGGGQRIFEHRSQTSQALVHGDSVIVIDTGFNAARQIAWAGLDAGSIDMIFITHDHRDHTQHIGHVLHAAWAAGRTNPIHIYSYPGIGDVIDVGLAEIENVDAAAVRSLAVLHELTEPGVIYRDNGIRVISVENTHGMDYSYAFRFDMPDRLIVFSGDTGYDERVVELAGGLGCRRAGPRGGLHAADRGDRDRGSRRSRNSPTNAAAPDDEPHINGTSPVRSRPKRTLACWSFHTSYLRK